MIAGGRCPDHRVVQADRRDGAATAEWVNADQDEAGLESNRAFRPLV
jgi:hypothetical protein